MTAVPPALPGTAQNKRSKESHEFTRLLLGKADMRVVIIRQKVRSAPRAVELSREGTKCQLQTTRLLNAATKTPEQVSTYS